MSEALAQQLNAVFVLAMCAMLGGAVSVRQVLLHIVPGTGSYGTAFFGLHLYTWALITFVAVAVIIAVMLMLDGQFDTGAVPPSGYPLHGLARAAFALVFAIAVANAATTFLMCGLAPCPDNPTAYLMFR